MVKYYYTATYIYAITNGYCSQVFHDDAEALSHSIVGTALLGGVTRLFDGELVPIDLIKPGMFLKFGSGGAVLVSDAVIFIDDARSLSIAPKPLSPNKDDGETVTIRDPIPTLPDILYPPKKVDGKE